MNMPQEIANKLQIHQWSLSIAESCTGGLVSSTLTAIPGASSWFNEGIVVYTPRSKQNRLNISMEDILKHGAVSSYISKQLANHIRISSPSDLGIGITGNAGPNISDKSKLGDVYIAISSLNDELCNHYSFKGNRLAIQDQAVQATLKMLFHYLCEKQDFR